MWLWAKTDARPQPERDSATSQPSPLLRIWGSHGPPAGASSTGGLTRVSTAPRPPLKPPGVPGLDLPVDTLAGDPCGPLPGQLLDDVPLPVGQSKMTVLSYAGN